MISTVRYRTILTKRNKLKVGKNEKNTTIFNDFDIIDSLYNESNPVTGTNCNGRT